MTDQEARRECFERVLDRLAALEISPLTRTDQAFTLGRNGHLFIFNMGEGSEIARARVQFKWTRTDDRSLELTVVRAAGQERFELRPGQQGDLDTIVEQIVATFLESTKDGF